MLSYSQAIRLVIKKGNYTPLFKVISYVFISLIIFNILLIFIDNQMGKKELLTFRILTIAILMTGFSYFIQKKTIQYKNIVFYEILLAFCLPISQFVTFFSNNSLWYLYGSVIIGGLFYGLMSGCFLIPAALSPVLYYLAFQLSKLFVYKNMSVTFDFNPGVFIVIWFSTIASSAARIGFDVYYYLRVALHDQALQLESIRKLKESAEQKLLLEKEIDKFKSVETLGFYAGGIAHDFNNMLTIIAGQMMSLRRTATDEFEKKNIESIMQAVKNTSGLIKKMLIFTGQYESHPKIFELNEIVDSTIELLRHGTDKKLMIESFIPDDIAWIHGDHDLFQTSLIGFLFNVITISKIKGVLSVKLSIMGEYRSASPGNFKSESILIKESAVLTIDGEFEISQDWQKKETFIEFMNVVNAMNGKLITGIVTGKETVQIVLPLSKSNSSEPEYNRHSNQDKSILVIDDDKMVLKSTEEVLLSAGYTVTPCNDAIDAVRIFKQKYLTIGLVLLDMRMPEMSGKELYFELKKIDPHVRVIIVSGYCSDIDVQEMLNGGALEYIEKPYAEDELCTKVALFI